MRVIGALSGCVVVAFVLACGGAGSDTTPVRWDGPDVELPVPYTETVPLTELPVPEAIQPEIAEDVADEVAAEVADEVADTVADDADPVAVTVVGIQDEEEAVNKPTGVEGSAQPTGTVVGTPAPAPVAVGVGQIQLMTSAAIQPMVDGVPMRLTMSQGFVAEVSAGKHSLEIRNLLGNVTGSAEVDVLDGRRTRYEWRRRNLTLLGDVGVSVLPSAVTVDEVYADDSAGDDKAPLEPAVPMTNKK